MRASFWNHQNLNTIPFLAHLYEEWKQTKPLAGLKILHNIPFTLDTLCKVDCLLHAGADVTLTQTKFIRPSISGKAMEYIPELGCPFYADHDKIPSQEYDFGLDCSGELASFFFKKGIVELTASGTNLYQKRAQQGLQQCPILSIDDSALKGFETFLGTGNGLVRALQRFSPRPLENLNILIFGYGKVGSGVAAALKSYTSEVTAVDVHQAAVTRAQQDHVRALMLDNHTALLHAIAAAECIITATGIPNFLGDTFPASLFEGKILANIGAEDEYGPTFPDAWVLGNKHPLNFLLDNPTEMKYLDPIMYIHNITPLIIAERVLTPGYHGLPWDIDQSILERWQAYHQESLPHCMARYIAQRVTP